MVNSRIRARLLEARMAARDSQIQLAEEQAGLGHWTLEPATGDLLWSTHCRQLLAASGDAAASFENFIGQIDGADQARVRRAFAQALQLRREFTVEFRSAQGAPLRCSGRPHASATSRETPALSGVMQAVEELAAGDAQVAQRMGAIVSRLEQLHAAGQ